MKKTNTETTQKTKIKKFIKRFIIVCLILGLLGGIYIGIANAVMLNSVSSLIYREDEITGPEEDCDCIIVLGCGIWEDNTPTPFMRDRLETSINLYKQGYAPKLLMSGDHGKEGYNEVGVMRQYAIDHGVPSEDIFMDHAGFSTYETMVRASGIFGIRKAIVVTQEFHIARSVYDCRAFGIECRGVIATNSGYKVFAKNYIRETLARGKDIIWCLIKPAPTYGGEKIDIHGSGEQTLD